MSAPFLPEPEAVVPQAPKKNTKKTLILWVVLVMLFLAIWQFLSPSDHPGAAPRAAASEPSPFWSSTVIALVPCALGILLIVVFMRAYRQNMDFNVAQEPGRIALAHRRFAEAVDLFRALAPQFQKQPAYHAVALLNLAEAELRAGRLDGAIATLAQIERARLLLFGSGVRVRVATLTAYIYALKGDLPVAERWVTDARARIAKNREDRIAHACALRIAEGLIACRRGDPREAVRLLEERWLELRYVFTADAMRSVEIVRAFAEAQAGLRASNTVGERLVRVEPVSPGEFGFLAVSWPEMAAFLDAHGLGAGASPGAIATAAAPSGAAAPAASAVGPAAVS